MLAFFKSFVDFSTTPSNFLLLIAIVALVALLFSWRKLGLSFLALSLLGFLGLGYSSLGEFLMAPLVTRFPPVDLATAPPPYGIIVLGSGVNEAHARYNGALLELEEGGEAIPTAVLLARRYPEAKLILSDGDGGDFPPAPMRVTDGMLRILTLFGIPRERIIVDTESSTTDERVHNTLALVGEDRDKVWWVMTPAHRMSRVIGTYRAAGFEPVAYPIDFKWIPPFDPAYTYPLVDGLRLTDDAVHEWRGLAMYYAAGKTATLFPGP